MRLKGMAVFGNFAAPRGIHGVSREEGVMRKFIVGLIMTGLLLSAGQASAADGGTADPQSLIASGVIQPFWASPGLLGDFTLFELTSPVGDNSGLWKGPAAWGFFYDVDCNKLFSRPLPMTENDILTLSTNDLPFLGGARQPGLLVVAGSFNNGLSLVPLENPVHSVGHWVSFARDFIRVIEPIQVAAAEAHQSYSPLRSAASWVNPPINGTTGEVLIVCPSSSVYDALAPSDFKRLEEVDEVTGFKRFRGFPEPPTVTSFVYGLVYDSDENRLADFTLDCSCLTRYDLSEVANNTYGIEDPGTEGVFYTEVFSYQDVLSKFNPPAFTGYLGLTVIDGFPGGTGDQFQRWNNGSAWNYLPLGDFKKGLR